MKALTLMTAMAAGYTAMLLASCSQTPASDLNNFVFNSKGANRAVIFMGSADGIPGVFKDPPNVKATLSDPKYHFGFTVSGGDKQYSVNEIVQQTGQVAGEMLSDPSATMFWYYTGHGAETGEMVGSDRNFYFKEVADAIKQARGNKALKRLIVLVDACFSGNLVDGNGAITQSLRGDEDGFGLAPGQIGGIGTLDQNVDASQTSRYLKAMNKFADQVVELRQGLYDELILVASSRKTETSGDAPDGGVGTTSFLSAMKSLSSNQNATVKMLIDQTVAGATGQTPVARTDPPDLMNATLFDDSSGGGARPATPSTPSTPSTPTPTPSPSPTPQDGSGDILGGILGGLGNG